MLQANSIVTGMRLRAWGNNWCELSHES